MSYFNLYDFRNYNVHQYKVGDAIATKRGALRADLLVIEEQGKHDSKVTCMIIDGPNVGQIVVIDAWTVTRFDGSFGDGNVTLHTLYIGFKSMAGRYADNARDALLLFDDQAKNLETATHYLNACTQARTIADALDEYMKAGAGIGSGGAALIDLRARKGERFDISK